MKNHKKPQNPKPQIDIKIIKKRKCKKKCVTHKLTCDDSKNDDNTIVELTEKKMEELKLMRGDQVLLRGK